MASPETRTITVGSPAPDFTLSSNKGEQVTLSSFRGNSVVVLFFYPKDGTSVCTKEACMFRDAYDDFAKSGATVIGVSSDSVQSHERFAVDNSLPFILLSDKNGAVRKLYNVKPTLGLIPGRATFVIDKQGIIQNTFESQLDAQKHVDQAMESVKKLVSEK